jgi:hypothetical protein
MFAPWPAQRNAQKEVIQASFGALLEFLTKKPNNCKV